ncbi:radical SAM/SPASM domain-containing protein [Helicobacter typhlonius]|uniref:radical SAM/SPASM domain-containing protein n=1 Tax=Helicobacter typhlonius TaxID=76936 RepID=UPI002FE1C742
MPINIAKRAIKFAYKHSPMFLKTTTRKLTNVDGFYTQKFQNHINSIINLSTPITDKALQKQILKHYLQIVEIEIASFCNRTCWFCPNSHIDRKSASIQLPEQTFLKIIENLAEIDYDKSLNFHRFNEPLANRELILKRVTQARKLLPKAKFTIFTNGDYAQREYFEALQDAGVNNILMSYYYGKNQSFDKQKVIIPAMKKMSHKLGLPYEVINDTMQEYRVRFCLSNLNIEYRTWNPQIIGKSRGGSVELLKQKRIIDSGCFHTAMRFYVDYNGLVMPCCNTRSDEPLHKDFILGDCNTQDLFEIFFAQKSSILRRELFSNDYCAHSFYADSIFKICSDCTDRERESFFNL